MSIDFRLIDFRFATAVCAVFLASAAVSTWALHRGLLRQDCGLKPAQTRAMVVEDLRDRGLPVRALTAVAENDACRHVFRYAGDGDPVEYAVANDWRRGVVLARHAPAGER
jgi:hypothetical protein